MKLTQVAGDAPAQVGEQEGSGDDRLEQQSEDEGQQVLVEQAAEEPHFLHLQVPAHHHEHGQHRRAVAQTRTAVSTLGIFCFKLASCIIHSSIS